MKYEMPQIGEGRHYLAWITAGFIAGIFFGLYFIGFKNIPLSFLICYSAIFVLCFLVLFVILPAFLKFNIMPTGDRLLVWLIVIGFIVGIFRIYIVDNIRHRDLESTMYGVHTYTGYLTADPEPSSSGKTSGFPVHLTSAKDAEREITLSDNIMVYTINCADLRRGDVISFDAQLERPADASFYGGFSSRNYLLKNGFYTNVFIQKFEKSQEVYEDFGFVYSLQSLGIAVQNHVLDIIETQFGEHPEEKALLKGILFGNKEDFTDEQYSYFADSGFIHITAASGMHVSFLCGFIFSVLRRLRFKRWLINIITVPILVIFAAAAAFTPSICRAVIMMLVYILAYLLQREPDSLTSLAFAALVLLCVNPYSITDYSFILSFSAVLGIIVYSAPVSNRIKCRLPKEYKGKKAVDFTLDSVCLSVSGNIGLGYFMARFFNRLSWGGIIGNIIIIPLAAISFVGGIIIYLVDLILPSAASLIADYPIRFTLWIMNRIAEFFSLSFFKLYLPTPAYTAFPIYILVCAAVYILLKPKENKDLTLNKE